MSAMSSLESGFENFTHFLLRPRFNNLVCPQSYAMMVFNGNNNPTHSLEAFKALIVGGNCKKCDNSCDGDTTFLWWGTTRPLLKMFGPDSIFHTWLEDKWLVSCFASSSAHFWSNEPSLASKAVDCQLLTNVVRSIDRPVANSAPTRLVLKLDHEQRKKSWNKN